MCITGVGELTRPCLRSSPNDGVVLMGNQSRLQHADSNGIDSSGEFMAKG